MTDPVLVAAALCLCVLVSEWLCRHTPLRHVGTALLVIVVTAILANCRLLPTANSPVYDGVFGYVAPLCIFWLLLQVNLRTVLRAGRSMLVMFLLGSAATTVGVIIGMSIVDGAEAFGDSYRGLGGMFVGTYTGGSINFNALALEYKIAESGVLYSGAMAVDSILTTVWMIATIAIPKGWKTLRRTAADSALIDASDSQHDDHTDAGVLSPLQLGLLGAAGLLTVWGSKQLGAAWNIPSILVLTTIALLLAQIPAVSRIEGAKVLGMFAVYIFLAVIGAYCDLAAVSELGTIGPALLLFVAIIIVVHGVVIFGGGLLLRGDIDVIAVASQANIGGGTTALALARSLKRRELVLPGILVGGLGNALGTYLGFVTAEHWL